MSFLYKTQFVIIYVYINIDVSVSFAPPNWCSSLGGQPTLHKSHSHTNTLRIYPKTQQQIFRKFVTSTGSFLQLVNSVQFQFCSTCMHICTRFPICSASVKPIEKILLSIKDVANLFAVHYKD